MKPVNKIVCYFLLAALVAFSESSFGQVRSDHFIYDKDDVHIDAAVHIADSLLNSPTVWNNIRTAAQQNMDSSKYTMSMLADTLEKFTDKIPVNSPSFISFHPIATADTHSPEINLFRKGYKQNYVWLAITLIHEWVHAVDFSLHHTSSALQFAHLDNQNPCVSKNTASYRVEQILVDMMRDKLISINQKDSNRIDFDDRYGCEN